MNMKTWFNREQKFRVILFHEDKRVTEHIVRRNKESDNTHNHLTINEETYVISSDKVFYYKGIPTAVYYENEPDALDPVQKKYASDLTSTDLYNAMEEKVSRDIIRFASNSDDDIKKITMIASGISVASVAVLGFFGFGEITTILEQQAEILDILDKLDTMNNLEGGFNNE